MTANPNLAEIEALIERLNVPWSSMDRAAAYKVDRILRERWQASEALTALLASHRRRGEALEKIAAGREVPLDGGGFVAGAPVTEMADLSPGDAAEIARQALGASDA